MTFFDWLTSRITLFFLIVFSWLGLGVVAGFMISIFVLGFKVGWIDWKL